MQNCTNNLNAKCHDVFPGDDGYKCFLVQYSMELTQTPIFAINSAYDLVAMRCIVMGEPLIGPTTSGVGNCTAIPGWEDCGNNFNCTPDQFSKMEEYAEAFRFITRNSPKLNSPGNGVFQCSCFVHAEEPNRHTTTCCRWPLWSRIHALYSWRCGHPATLLQVS